MKDLFCLLSVLLKFAFFFIRWLLKKNKNRLSGFFWVFFFLVSLIFFSENESILSLTIWCEEFKIHSILGTTGNYFKKVSSTENLKSKTIEETQQIPINPNSLRGQHYYSSKTLSSCHAPEYDEIRPFYKIFAFCFPSFKYR